MSNVHIIDISWPLSDGMVVYPKNPEVHIEQIDTGHSILNKIQMGSHTGTHVDVPAHVVDGGRTLGNISLTHFIGPCQVIDCTNVKEKITEADLEGKDIEPGGRVLLKTTNSALDVDTFHDNYVYLDGDAAEYLVKKRIQLIGIDYLSIKQKGGEDERPHTALLEARIPIIEGLRLDEADEGTYILSALPVKFDQLGGAPVRAILLKQ